MLELTKLGTHVLPDMGRSLERSSKLAYEIQGLRDSALWGNVTVHEANVVTIPFHLHPTSFRPLVLWQY